MRPLSLLFVIAGLCNGPSIAATYVVHPDGTGDFPTIQAAIDAAVDNDTIELTAGRFVDQGNRNLHFDGKAITLRSRDGNPESCILDCEGSSGAYQRALRFDSGEQGGSLVQGLSLTGCFFGWGGAVSCTNGSSPRFSNCRFVANEARYQGGALFCSGGSSPALEGCAFLGNIADSEGGAIFCEESASPAFTDCTFEGNSLTGDASCSGGAVYLSTSSSAEFTGCCFRDNHAQYGGALVCNTAASTQIASCVFEANRAERAGGGVSCDRGTPVFDSCLFEENGAATYGGAMRGHLTADITVSNCLFVRNHAGWGGGALYVEEATTQVSATTIVFSDAPVGGGIFCAGGSLALENALIAFSVYGHSVDCTAPEPDLVVSCCDFYGNAGGDWSGCLEDQYGMNGNFSADPLFCDPDNDDFTLRNDSSCAEENNPECGQIGARSVGCDVPVAVEKGSWGGIKRGFR